MTRFILPVSRWAISLALAAFFHTALLAQSDRAPRETALLFLRENPAQFNLSAQDVADLRVVDEYRTEGLGLAHVWVQQQHLGIPVFNALFGLHVKADGEVIHVGHRFVADLKARVNTTLPALSAQKALEMAMLHLGFEGFEVPGLRQKINDRNWVFAGGAVSRGDIPVSICYEQTADGRLRLAWTMLIDQANTSDYWNLRVDALTGQVIGKINHTVYCKAGQVHYVGEDCEAESTPLTPHSSLLTPPPPSGDGSKYRVFPFPTQSPIHGAHVIVTEPADPVASPYGWHDTNAAAGPEYNYTRGNNVFAYEDSDGNNAPPATPQPVGGSTLNFDFPYNPAAEPISNLDAAVTNLFYASNMMHDITYNYGFSEISRNFQVNNYGAAGAPNDPVLAEAIDGSGENNSNFTTLPDGTSGRMQMYRWARQGGKIVTVNAPSGVVGKYFAAGAAGWGKPISTTPVTGLVAIADDGSSTPAWACNPLVNNVSGKIVMADRSFCTFSEKALNAQQAGAIACIICNLQNGTINMGPGTVGGQVTIPVVMMPKSDCDLLRQYAGNAGLNVSIGFDAAVVGPNYLDGDFDNSIISHEYGHGISQRLTGSSASCLGNAEQMGEGWSDFFSLAITAKPGDKGSDKRGIGTFALNQSINDTGIRRYPYSTNMSISPLDYSSVSENTLEHAVGEVWAAMIWDLYWAMADKYGFDANITNTNSGNGRAFQLVMDGLKLQPCNPGFQDGRDAILRADKLRYGGADTCLISSVFARRGLGYYANQGSSNNASDGKANFDPIPYCVKNLKITKTTSTPTITAGDEAWFSIKVANHKDESAENVKVSDELPAGLTFLSASDGGKFENGHVVWDLGSMPSLTAKTLTYKAKSAANIGCDVLYNDDLEVADDWFLGTPKGTGFFELQNNVVKTGSYAWLANGTNDASDFTLEMTLPFTVQGSRPHLRFWHQYDSEIGVDAGFLEIRQQDQPGWAAFPAEKVVRHPYAAKIPYSVLAIPSLSGFSGTSAEWVQSYIDLSAYAGKSVMLRFRVGTNASSSGTPAKWYVDDLEQVQLVNFDGEACVNYTGGISACAKAPESGVVVNRGTNGTHEASANSLPLLVQPNPASDLLNVTLGQAVDGPVQLSITNADGRFALSVHRDNYTVGQVLTLDISQLPAGVYLLRVQTSTGNGVEKVVVRR